MAFTADPVTGERHVVRIAATKGLGEALVQGEVIGSDITVRGDVVDGDLAGLPVEHATAVAMVAREIEVAFGRPQDIEWAVADGHVHVLQARPITVLPVEPTPAERQQLAEGRRPLPRAAHPLRLLAAWRPTRTRSTGCSTRWACWCGASRSGSSAGEIYGRVLPAMGSADDARTPPPAAVVGIAARLVPAMRKRNAAARAALEADLPGTWEADWHATDRDDMSRRTETPRMPSTSLRSTTPG